MMKAALIFLFISIGSLAHALLPQTERDLMSLEEQLRDDLAKNPGTLSARLPVLLAPPQAYWSESQGDFGPRTLQMLTRVFGSDASRILPCAECRQHRTYVDHDGRLQVHNGDLGLTEFAQVKTNPAFSDAKSMLVIEETPGGIALRWIGLDDGRLLFSTLADSTETLESVVPRLNFAREAERRRHGEALSYLFFDLGLYPNVTVQTSWLEQWGNRNQFITGVTLSLIKPNGGVGGTFMYMLPHNRRQTLSLTGFYLLRGLAPSSDDSDSGVASSIVAQLKYEIAVGSSYGLFASANTQGTFTVGITLFNPVFFPFLL